MLLSSAQCPVIFAQGYMRLYCGYGCRPLGKGPHTRRQQSFRLHAYLGSRVAVEQTRANARMFSLRYMEASKVMVDPYRLCRFFAPLQSTLCYTRFGNFAV